MGPGIGAGAGAQWGAGGRPALSPRGGLRPHQLHQPRPQAGSPAYRGMGSDSPSRGEPGWSRSKRGRSERAVEVDVEVAVEVDVDVEVNVDVKVNVEVDDEIKGKIQVEVGLNRLNSQYRIL